MKNMNFSYITNDKSEDPINRVSTSLMEEAELITLLRAWGISYLTGGLPEQSLTAEAAERESAPELLRRLARCNNVRVRDAIISLLLLHPELAEAMPIAIRQGSHEDGETLIVLTLATLY